QFGGQQVGCRALDDVFGERRWYLLGQGGAGDRIEPLADHDRGAVLVRRVRHPPPAGPVGSTVVRYRPMVVAPVRRARSPRTSPSGWAMAVAKTSGAPSTGQCSGSSKVTRASADQ